jgi:hypothetical protein
MAMRSIRVDRALRRLVGVAEGAGACSCRCRGYAAGSRRGEKVAAGWKETLGHGCSLQYSPMIAEACISGGERTECRSVESAHDARPSSPQGDRGRGLDANDARKKTSEVPSDPATWLWLAAIRIHPYEHDDGCSHLWWKIAVNLKSTRALGESGRAIGKTAAKMMPRVQSATH